MLPVDSVARYRAGTGAGAGPGPFPDAGGAIMITLLNRATYGRIFAGKGNGTTACKYRDTFSKWAGKPSEIQLCSSSDHGGVFKLFAYLLCFVCFTLCTRTHARMHARMYACNTHNIMYITVPSPGVILLLHIASYCAEPTLSVVVSR